MTNLKFPDLVKQGLDRVPTQYKSSNINQIIKAVLNVVTDIQQTHEDIYLLRDLDKATGHTLDIIGKLVGQSRLIQNKLLIENFGFKGVTQSTGFGTLVDSSVGGVFKSLYEDVNGYYPLDDYTYRGVIKAKIIKNYSACTTNEVISASKYILNDPKLGMNIEEGSSTYEFTGQDFGEFRNPITLRNFDLSVTFKVDTTSSGYILGSKISRLTGMINQLYGVMNYLRVDSKTTSNNMGYGQDPTVPVDKPDPVDHTFDKYGDGYIQWVGRDLIVNINTAILKWVNVLPLSVDNINAVRLVRTGRNLKLFVNNVDQGKGYDELSGQYTNYINDGAWELGFVGKDVSSVLPSSGGVFNLRVKTDDNDLTWFCDTRTSSVVPVGYLKESSLDVAKIEVATDDLYTFANFTLTKYLDTSGSINSSSYDNYTTTRNNTPTDNDRNVPLTINGDGLHFNNSVLQFPQSVPTTLADYTLEYKNYNPNGWTTTQLGITINFYKKLNLLEKVLLKEFKLLPTTIGVPVKYIDQNGEF